MLQDAVVCVLSGHCELLLLLALVHRNQQSKIRLVQAKSGKKSGRPARRIAMLTGGEGKTAPVINGAVLERVNLDFVGR
jgi:hypothetical protein